MMLPILISVSVAPVSYFFWARAWPPVKRSSARATETAPNRRWIAGISDLLGITVDVSCFFIGSDLRLLVALNTFHSCPATKSPPRDGRGRRHLVERVREYARGAEY